METIEGYFLTESLPEAIKNRAAADEAFRDLLLALIITPTPP